MAVGAVPVILIATEIKSSATIAADVTPLFPVVDGEVILVTRVVFTPLILTVKVLVNPPPAATDSQTFIFLNVPGVVTIL